MTSPSQLHLDAVHSPSKIEISKKQSYGPGLLFFYVKTTSATHPTPNQESAGVAYFGRDGACKWDMAAN